MSKWNIDEFTTAGFSASFYDELKYIAHDEEGHFLYLEAGLTAAGAKPGESCTYSFPMTKPKEFVSLASVIEGVGLSAYLGAAADITSKAYLTAAGSILITEALHQSATRGAVGKIPIAHIFGTPMGLNAVYTIASGFITACSSTNIALPVMAYPSLTLQIGDPTAPNATIYLKPENMPSSTCYATFVSGLMILPVSTFMENGWFKAVVPVGVSGQSYVFLTSDSSGNVTDSSVIAGKLLPISLLK